MINKRINTLTPNNAWLYEIAIWQNAYGNVTVSSISLVWPAEMQNLALSSVIFVAGKPTPTVASLYSKQFRTKAEKEQKYFFFQI